MLHLKDGNRSEAYKSFQKAVDISPQIARSVIQASLCVCSMRFDCFEILQTQKLKEEKVEFVVAPNEADAQLAHLSRTGLDLMQHFSWN